VNKINIKPLSVNAAFQGRRFKTSKYKRYEKNVLLLLPRLKIPKGKLEVTLTFGFSSKLCDLDNPVKLIIDCFQKKYKFNDRDIYKLTVFKVDVGKREEFIEFDIKEFN